MVAREFDGFDDGYGDYGDGSEEENPAEEDGKPMFGSLVGEAGEMLMEDEAKNQRQARRNLRIRGLLKGRRDTTVEELLKPDTLGEVATITDLLEPKPAKAEDEVSELPPWLVYRDEPSEVSLRLHEELLDFAAFMRPTIIESAARDAWTHTLQQASESLWPQARVHVFGSTATKLNLPNADVDVAIVNIEGVRATTAMKKLAELLLEREEVSKIEIIQSAKVPVMKVQHRNTGLMADIVVNRTDGLETAQFIDEQMRLFPALSPLVLFLKLFLSQRNLHETFMGGMGSYVLVCVVLSFLQHHKSAQSSHLHSVTTLGNLLLDFFRYYGQEFRYAATGISVREGGSLFDRAKRGWTATTRSGQATLCLESPTEPSLDIGGRIFKIGLVRAAFNHGYQVLSALFLAKKPPEGSLLCPFLLRQDHPTIAERYQLYREQPAPFLEGVGRPESDEEAQEPTPKRRRGEDAPTVDVPLTEPAEPVPAVPAEDAEELGDALAFLAETEEVAELGGALDFLAAELPGADNGELEDEDDEAYDPLAVLPEVFDTEDPAGDKDALAAAAHLLNVDPQVLAEEQRLLQEQIQLLEEIQVLEASAAELEMDEEGDGYADPGDGYADPEPEDDVEV